MSNKFFKSATEFHIMSTALVSVIGALNLGRSGKFGTISITANGRGYSIKMGRHTFAKGRTPQELHDNFEGAVEKAKKESA